MENRSDRSGVWWGFRRFFRPFALESKANYQLMPCGQK